MSHGVQNFLKNFYLLRMGNDEKKPRNKFRLPIELAVNDDVARKR